MQYTLIFSTLLAISVQSASLNPRLNSFSVRGASQDPELTPREVSATILSGNEDVNDSLKKRRGRSGNPGYSNPGGVSPDAMCGGHKGYTCLGSRYGNCCSQYGWW
jgi:hypothetical protein